MKESSRDDSAAGKTLNEFVVSPALLETLTGAADVTFFPSFAFYGINSRLNVRWRLCNRSFPGEIVSDQHEFSSSSCWAKWHRMLLHVADKNSPIQFGFELSRISKVGTLAIHNISRRNTILCHGPKL